MLFIVGSIVLQLLGINTTLRRVSSMGKPTVTSMKVDGELWKKAKIQAIQEGISLQELLSEALEMRLKDTDRKRERQ
jgi:hypothetical protein